MCSFVFAGCNLVQRNTDRYLNRTVATIGNEITITKKDLITAYNSYGYQYVQNYGYTAEKALKTTLDGLIDRQLVLTEAKKFIKVDDETKQVYYVTYNTAQKNLVNSSTTKMFGKMKLKNKFMMA